MNFQTVFESILANWHLIILFFTAAILYSSVGFGGGSSYLAILAFAGIAFTQIRVTALLCNIVVVFGNVMLFYQQKKIPWKKVIPIVLWSVPLAYLGGRLAINKTLFFILLGFTLLFAALSMWISKRLVSTVKEKKTFNTIQKFILRWRYRISFWYGRNWWRYFFSTAASSKQLGYSKKNSCNG